MSIKIMSARLFIGGVLIALTAAMPMAARAEDAPVGPPVAAKDKLSGSELTAHLVGAAIPDANFLGQSSRMAIGRSKNAKIVEFAQDMAKAQTAAATSLTAWVNAVGPIVTDRSAYPGRTERPPAGRVSAPQMLPAQVEVLQRLSTLQGRDFDALYLSTQKDALQRLATAYQGYIDADGEPSLRAVAVRELAKAQDRLSMLDSLSANSANEAGTRRRRP